MQQNSFPREVACALLSPSFGAHQDCPPGPTEQWLYGWVNRYLNLSAKTVTHTYTLREHKQTPTPGPGSTLESVLLQWHCRSDICGLEISGGEGDFACFLTWVCWSSWFISSFHSSPPECLFLSSFFFYYFQILLAATKIYISSLYLCAVMLKILF